MEKLYVNKRWKFVIHGLTDDLINYSFFIWVFLAPILCTFFAPSYTGLKISFYGIFGTGIFLTILHLFEPGYDDYIHTEEERYLDSRIDYHTTPG